MKKINQNIVAAALGCIAFVVILGWAGDVDFTDQVILSMSQEEYDNVKSHLTSKNGRKPSESEIAHWWVENRNN